MTTATNDILSYRVPKLSPDGSCSAEKGGLEDEPYDLRGILGATSFAREEEVTIRVRALYDLLDEIQTGIKADWIGIYQAAINVYGERVLVKLAYHGSPSRAEFPLTQEFATLSNNSTVGITGEAVIIESVAQHRGAYYTCDVHVKSEACLPIFNDAGAVIGIVDAESFVDGHFNKGNVLRLEALCTKLSSYLPI